MTLSAAERRAINLQNAQKSHGPKSQEGKVRSKFNALKHGLKAKTVVLPGEDAQQYQGLLDAWIADLQPQNDVELALVERAVTLTWQLDRAKRAETARLAGLIRAAPADAALRREEEAAALGQRLFFDRRGPLPLYPHSLYTFPDRPRVSFSGLSDDPDDPPRLLLRLEATAEGCRWLLDRWADLRSLLDRGLSWQSPDKLRAIRMLGRQPLDAADSEIVATIFQACHVLEPQTHHQAGAPLGEAATAAEALRTLKAMGPGVFARLGDEPGSHHAAEPKPNPEPDEDPEEAGEGEMDQGDAAAARLAWRRCGAAFSELLGELTAEEARAYRHRLEGRRVDQLRPQDPAAARATLRAIVEKATIRLGAKLEVHQAQAPLAAAEAVDRLGFDDSLEGERLRRFQLASHRALLRTLDALGKPRRSEPPPPAGGEPAAIGSIGDVLTATIDCGPEGIHSHCDADPLPAVADTPVGPPAPPQPAPEVDVPPNESTAAGVEPPNPPAGSSAAMGDSMISPNEPTTPAGGTTLARMRPERPQEPSPGCNPGSAAPTDPRRPEGPQVSQAPPGSQRPTSGTS
jgi:hypothetical protein